MIYFISNKSYSINPIEGALSVPAPNQPLLYDYLCQLNTVCFDTETNSLDPYIGDILLVILGDKVNQYVFDTTCPQTFERCKEIIFYLNRKLCLWIGQNGKFDYKFIKTKFNISLNRIYDTMIVEQRICQGMTEFSIKKNKRVPLGMGLDKILLRRFKVVPTGMDKNIRDEFVGANPNTFNFENRHIFYAAGDIVKLEDLREIQKKDLVKYNLENLLYRIELPLITILGDCELNGFNINEEQWRKNIIKNKELKYETELTLDKIFKELRELYAKENLIYLSNGKYDRERKKSEEQEELNLFGDLFEEIEINKLVKPKKEKSSVNKNYLTYTQQEILFICFALGLEMPTKDGEYKVPEFKLKKGKFVLDKSNFTPTTDAKFLEEFKVAKSNSTHIEFITQLINLRKYEKKITTYGENFLVKFKNSVSGFFHTIFRQCDAITSRFQSGDEKNGWYNAQNLPRENEYRTPFHYKDYDIITTDLSGAEAVIMIDKARDEKFYEIAIKNDDAHSPIAQAVWRAIGEYRYNYYSTLSFKDIVTLGLSEELVKIELEKADKLRNIIIDKKTNKDLRTNYKPATFGNVYGMGIRKRAKTLGISEEESKIAGQVQEQFMPKTFKLMKQNAYFASTNGYIILNNRTNSRIWFSEFFEAQRAGQELDNYVKHEIESTAKNAPIQGTQADMIKETIVEIHKEAQLQNLYRPEVDLRLLSQVHDETVYACKNANIEVEFTPERIENNQIITLPPVKCPLHEFINKMHRKIPNRYLSYIEMAAETHVGKTWEK